MPGKYHSINQRHYQNLQRVAESRSFLAYAPSVQSRPHDDAALDTRESSVNPYSKDNYSCFDTPSLQVDRARYTPKKGSKHKSSPPSRLIKDSVRPSPTSTVRQYFSNPYNFSPFQRAPVASIADSNQPTNPPTQSIRSGYHTARFISPSNYPHSISKEEEGHTYDFSEKYNYIQKWRIEVSRVAMDHSRGLETLDKTEDEVLRLIRRVKGRAQDDQMLGSPYQSRKEDSRTEGRFHPSEWTGQRRETARRDDEGHAGYVSERFSRC